jgi:hypothetical protein
MKPHELTLLKHKDFIWATTKDLIIPSKGNDVATEILAAYNEIDNTVEVLYECSTCTNIYRDSFKIIWAYCESVNWFKVVELKPKPKNK